MTETTTVDASAELRQTERDLKEVVMSLAYFTECQLATFEGLKEKKSTPKTEIKRQRDICFRMVLSAAAHKRIIEGNNFKNCSRLRVIFENPSLNEGCHAADLANPM